MVLRRVRSSASPAAVTGPVVVWVSKAAGGADKVQRDGLVIAPGAVVDAQRIGKLARAILGHGPLRLAVGGRRDAGDDATPGGCHVVDDDLGPVDPGGVVGRGPERHRLACLVARAQIAGRDVQDRGGDQPVVADVDVRGGGLPVGRALRGGGGERPGDGLPLDRDREAERREAGPRRGF
jgi:hypothetical protein